MKLVLAWLRLTVGVVALIAMIAHFYMVREIAKDRERTLEQERYESTHRVFDGQTYVWNGKQWVPEVRMKR